MSPFVLKPLPPAIDLDTKSILKKSAVAHRYLAELKGVSETIPNQGILINALALQEANYYINVKLYSIYTNSGIVS
jgi:Fic family protein